MKIVPNVADTELNIIQKVLIYAKNADGANNLITIFLMKNFMMKKKIIIGYPN